MVQLKTQRTMVSLAVASACTWLVMPVAAQQAPTAPEAEAKASQLDTVVVTGIRASLEKALDLKRDAIGIRDSIVAEDIGKFPEQNIADALVRLPGVEVVKDPGTNEGQTIQLRGLGAQYTVTSFNGVQVRTTSSGSIGGASRNFNYDVFASELFSRADVYKTPVAEVIEGGVAGVVDLRTPRPFDHKGRTIKYSLAGAYNERSRYTSPRAHVLFSNTWDKVGLLVSVASSKNRNGSNSFETTGGYNNALQRFDQGAFNFSWNKTHPLANLGTLTPLELDTANMPRYLRMVATENRRDRTGLNTSLQYKDSTFDISWDTLYSSMEDDYRSNGLSFPVRRVTLSNTAFGGPLTAANSQLIPIDVRVDANNNLQGTVGNLPMESSSFAGFGKTNFAYNALNGRYQASDRLVLIGQAALSSSKANRSNVSAGAVDNSLAGRHTVTFDLSDPFAPNVSTNKNLLDPLNYTTFSYSGSYRTEEDKLSDVSLRAEYDYSFLGIDSKLKTGFSSGKSTKRLNTFSTKNLVNEQVIPGVGAYATASFAQQQAYMRPFLVPNELGNVSRSGGGNYPGDWLVLGRDYIYGTLDSVNANKNADLNRAGTFEASESINALFLQSDFETQLFGRDLRANVGVRHIKTDTDIDNYTLIAGVYEPTNRKGSYTNTLPSVSAAYNLSRNLVWRAAYGETISRSSISLIARSYGVPNAGNKVIDAGNPNLKPEESKGYDTSLEWYFAKGGVIAASAFEKKITGRPASTSTEVPFNSLGLPATLFTANIAAEVTNDPTTPIEVRSFTNSEAFKVSGFELSYQQAFRFLPEPFNGLGLIASYTNIKTAGVKRTYKGNEYELPIVPENTYAISGYYERGPLSLRMSYNHKSEFANYGQSGTNPQGYQRWYNSRGYLDATVGYKFSNALELRFDVSNLTRTKTYDFFRHFEGLYGDENSRVEAANQHGRTFTVTLRGSF
ncbi:TonB-dependent receptor [Paucibacter sp. M5-1]|uniref:TonB-dependent receptor n=1 Tax=Paucibacter sp. M5-1 TaxID=3015998 RepID=UPI0022B86784|nr:TonB-dependent receptor [Paucibacter sp. M5-1]MCZ7883027.1 TonB-dependent receptor [Paucibacter sp. M5-1]